MAARLDARELSSPAEVISLDGDWLAVPDGRSGDVLVWGGCSALHSGLFHASSPNLQESPRFPQCEAS